MDFEKLIISARSVRRFSGKPLPEGFLTRMVNYARLSPSTRNLQFLKFLTLSEPSSMNAVFPLLHWAGALKDWKGPSENERPAGYVVILLDENLSTDPNCDHGIVAQSMVLGAAAEGIGCCIIGNFHKNNLSETLRLPENLSPCLVLAFGYPGEKIVLEDAASEKGTTYYRDASDIHHVPKRPLTELLYDQI